MVLIHTAESIEMGISGLSNLAAYHLSSRVVALVGGVTRERAETVESMFLEVRLFDIQKREMEFIKSHKAPQNRKGHSVVALQDGAYVFGGASVGGDKAVLEGLLKLNVINRKVSLRDEAGWTIVDCKRPPSYAPPAEALSPDGLPVPPVVEPIKVPPPRYHHAACAISTTQMIIFGGKGANGKLLNDLWLYDCESQSWEEVTGEGDRPPPLSGASLAAFSHGGQAKLIVVGGVTDDAPSAKSYILNLTSSMYWTCVVDKGSGSPEKPRRASIAAYDYPSSLPPISFASATAAYMDGQHSQLKHKVTLLRVPTPEPPASLAGSEGSGPSAEGEGNGPMNESVIVFGGLGVKGAVGAAVYKLSDTLDHWIHVGITGRLTSRYSAGCVRLPQSNEVAIIGGIDSRGGSMGDILLLKVGVVKEEAKNELPPGVEKIEFPNGDEYLGEAVNGSPSGKGTMTYSNGSSYEGLWTEGIYDGVGRFVDADGSSYDGSWHNGERCGLGLEVYPDGSTYEGNWKHNRRNGEGTFINKKPSAKYSVYAGEWSNDEMHGLGTATHAATGYSYKGYFSHNQRNGLCELESMRDGEKYSGEYKNDFRHGLGEMQFRDGSKYHGDFKLHKRNGHGTLVYSNKGAKLSNIYEGKFVADEPCGKGVLKYCNGDRYEGVFQKGQRHGEGTCYYKNGDVYSGSWKNNLRAGTGVLTVKGAAHSQRGTWIKDKLSHHADDVSVTGSEGTVKNRGHLD